MRTVDNFRVIDLQLEGYNGRNTAQCKPDHLGVLAKLCPKIEKMHLSMTWPESFLFLSRFRNISHLSVFRVSSVENFDLPLMVTYISQSYLVNNNVLADQVDFVINSYLTIVIIPGLRWKLNQTGADELYELSIRDGSEHPEVLWQPAVPQTRN